ncbi:MAG: glycogen debranching enzyme N-terminal domain-containing protein [Egibacteraceae bacterium]
MTSIALGPQTCTSLAQGSRREWLVADGLGGYAMGTVAGLRTRRYHGLLVVATAPPAGRHLALVALDPVLVIGDTRVGLGTHRWSDGTLAPDGFTLLATFTLDDGVPRWRWQVGDIVIDREAAMVRGRPAVAVHHRLVAGSHPVRLELEALCTWRSAHGERFGTGAPDVEPVAGGFVFERHYRVHGPGFVAGGDWYRGVRHDEELERGLPAMEDLFCAGRFTADLHPGDHADVAAWTGDLDDRPPPAATQHRRRHAVVRARARTAHRRHRRRRPRRRPARCAHRDHRQHVAGTRYGIAVDPADGPPAPSGDDF